MSSLLKDSPAISPAPYLPRAVTAPIHSRSPVGLPILDISLKQNHTLWDLCLACFTEHNVHGEHFTLYISLPKSFWVSRLPCPEHFRECDGPWLGTCPFSRPVCPSPSSICVCPSGTIEISLADTSLLLPALCCHVTGSRKEKLRRRWPLSHRCPGVQPGLGRRHRQNNAHASCHLLVSSPLTRTPCGHLNSLLLSAARHVPGFLLAASSGPAGEQASCHQRLNSSRACSWLLASRGFSAAVFAPAPRRPAWEAQTAGAECHSRRTEV